MQGITDVTSGFLITQLKQQLRIAVPDTNLNIRVISVRGWGPLVAMNSASALSPLRVTFWSLISNVGASGVSNYSIQEEVYDYPDQVRRAAIGYEYPIAQQQAAMNEATGQPILHITDGAGPGNLFYIRLLWRTREPDLVDFDSLTGKFVY